MKRFLVFLYILIFNFISIDFCFASMHLYISNDCRNCDEVSKKGKEMIQLLKDKGELEVVDVSDMETDLPALPALVDGEKVIIGTGLLEYLGEKAGIEFSKDD